MHLIVVTTDTDPAEGPDAKQAEYERLRELLMSANVVMELGFDITQVRQPSRLAQP